MKKQRRKAEASDLEQMTPQQRMQYLQENVDIRKPPKRRIDPQAVRRMALCVSCYILCYILILALIFGMVVLNDIHNWVDYFRTEYSNVLFLIVSVFFLVVIIFFYFFFEDRELLVKTSNTLLIFSLIILCASTCYLLGRFVSIYIRPFALFALLVLFLLNRRQAIFLNFIFTFLIFVIDMYTNAYAGRELVEEVYSTLMVGFVSGTLAVFVAGNVKTRAGLIFTGVVLALPTSLVVALLNLSSVENNWWLYLTNIGYRMLGSIISAMLALAFLPIFESIFNKLTVFRLRELTSTNAPLLSRLKKEAPGTFNHSLIVAQLSEACAVAIGENAELARAAAYYHDVGKLKDPQCFTENQGDYNVHNELTPDLSADIIRAHAKDGYDLLIANHLPKAIADVALEHHGTLPIKYFFNKAFRISAGEANIVNYSYFGPTPQTKIAAIVMIADGAEAATRSLKDHSPENVEKTVRAIIEERMDLGQFADCSITMRDLTTIKQTLVETLTGVHHHRVEYPSMRFNRDKSVEKEEKENGKNGKEET